MSIKLGIFYYSSTGTNYQMALKAKETAEAAGHEVRLRKVAELAPQAAIDSNPAWRAHVEATKDVPEASLDDLDWAEAYIFSVPTRFGNVAAQMKQFLDTTGGLWYQGKLSNKPVTAFTSAQNPHGGQEATLLALYNTFHHWGALIVSPGYTNEVIFASGGNPYGVSTSGPSEDGVADEVLATVAYSTERLLQVATWLKKGQEA
jgi:NAD(P)H dehydrogenase (quinone)